MKTYQILIFIFLIFLILAGICIFFPQDGVLIGNRKLYFPTLEEALTYENGKPESASERVESLRIKSIIDSTAKADSLKKLFYLDFFENHPSRIHLPEDDLSFFNSLFDDLDSCRVRKEVVHILHYGDSQIERDRITGYIRMKLQEKFGGSGPGLIPAIQPIPSAAIGQACSDSLSRYMIDGNLRQRTTHSRYGILAQVAEFSGNTTISVFPRNWDTTFDNTKEFSKIRLFVGNNDSDFSASFIIPERETSTKHISNAQRKVSVLTWNLKSPISAFSLQLSGKAEVYGIAIDGSCGVAVDNIPLRGSSGTFFTKIDADVLAPAMKELNTKLIIMEFGGNVMPSINGAKGVARYKKLMSRQISYLKKIYPKAKILLIGPADMSTKVNGKLQTYPWLEENIQGLREAAIENGAAFWDMYEVMGGKNSMINWVNNDPPWASTDHIHFTLKGADRIAELFVESLMTYYDYYKFSSMGSK